MTFNLIDILNSIVLPSYCITCGKEGPYLCAKCLRLKYKVNFVKICHVCGIATFKNNLHKECEDCTNLANLVFFCEYNNAAKRLIEEVKYNGSFAIIDELAIHMSNFIRQRVKNLDSDHYLLTFVPSHLSRRNERGFNQSELLAVYIGRRLNIEVKELLKKDFYTRKQAGQNKSFRATNLHNSFSFKGNSEDKVVIIVDDVHTTGTTLNGCAKVLIANGFSNIWGFTFAKSLNYTHASKTTGFMV